MGNGTEINYHDALYWFRRSADEINDKDSMFKVAYMFEKGLGTDVNLSMALQYNEQSANYGHVEGQHKMGKNDIPVSEIRNILIKGFFLHYRYGFLAWSV